MGRFLRAAEGHNLLLPPFCKKQQGLGPSIAVTDFFWVHGLDECTNLNMAAVLQPGTFRFLIHSHEDLGPNALYEMLGCADLVQKMF